MDRNTVVRVKVPMSLYESIKGKILNEDKAKKLKNPESIHENDDYSKYELLTDNLQEALYAFIDEGDYRQGDEEQLKSDVDSAISRLVDQYIKRKFKPRGIEEAKKKPSAGMTKKEKSAVVKKAEAGKDIGKKGKGFEKVAAKAAKEYGSKEKGEKVAAAQMWKAQAGKKKMNEEGGEESDITDTYMEELVRANDAYESGLEAYSEGDMLKAERMYQMALKVGSGLGLQFPTYEELTSGRN